MRESGWYWVRMCNYGSVSGDPWMVAEFIAEDGCWLLAGDSYTDVDWREIDERRIIRIA